MRRKSLAVKLGLAAILSLASAASAENLDLTDGGSGDINSAVFATNEQQPTGSGVIHSFVRISAANEGEVEGYNTDGRPLQYDENTSPTFTRSLHLDALQSVTLNGVSYYQFLLDINQLNSGEPERLLSLTELQIFLRSAGNLAGATSDGNGGITFPDGTKVYDLDAPPDGDSRIDLNYDLNSGSGSGDMYAYIPTALFTGPNKYVYLYSKFGNATEVIPPYPNNDGYEEWAAVVGPNSVVVPVPAAVWGGMALCGFVGAAKLRRRSLSAAAE